MQAEIHGPTEPSRDCAMHSQTGPHHAARQDALEGRKTNEQHAQTPGGHGRRSCPAGAASLVHPAGAKTQSLGVRLVLKFWDESRRKIELERRCRRQPSVVRVIARANQVVGAHRALHPGCCCLACVRNDAPGKLCETGSKLSSLTWEPTFRHKASEYSCPAKQRRNSPRKGAEKSGRRGQSKDETRRGGRQGSIGRERRVRQAKGCTAQGGSFSNQKTFGVSQPFISIDREPQQRGREGGIEGFRHAIVRLRGLI